MSDSTPKAKKKLLLIGWDGADWEHINPLLEEGLLPHLRGLIERGVKGNLATLQPVLSPMLWNSIATGKYAYKHGIHGFIEKDPNTKGARPFSSHSRKTKALWNILNQEGYRSNVINWWASHPAEPVNGCIVSNLFAGVKHDARKGFEIADGVVHPAEKAKHFAQYKVFPAELTAEQLIPFAPRAAEINQDEDSRLETLASVVSEMLTTHSVGTAVMEEEPWDFMAVYYTAVDHFSHAFMQYHPPRLPWINEESYEVFKDVIRGCYRFSDMALGRLLQLAGEDTTVVLCSDHGFQSGAQRPFGMPKEPAGPAIWHRQFGIFVMAGPGIKQGEEIYSASLIDITPTILTALGLPIGEDMDGRPLLEAFEQTPHVETVPTWDDVDGDSGMHHAEQDMNPDEAQELLRQFVALGYIDDPGDDKEKQGRDAEIESNYNVARNLLFAGLVEEALPLFERIVHAAPWESRFITQLVEVYIQTGYLKQARELLRDTFDLQNNNQLQPRMLLGRILLAEGRTAEAVEVLAKIERLASKNAGVQNQIGTLYLTQRRWDDAERCFDRALVLNSENSDALQGLSSVYCRRGENQKTIDAALAAVSLVQRKPNAHRNLGIALARGGEPEKAVVALETALKFSPRMAKAHRWLAKIHKKTLDNPEQAALHAEAARTIADERKQKRRAFTSRKSDLRHLPTFETEERRAEILNQERPDRVDRRKPSGKTFVLVSGLPRSGTSMMMQMLDAGGMPIKSDGERTADVDNPKGYYEWEDIKKVEHKPQIMNEDGLDEKVIKVVSPLLSKLPYAHQYKVVFMTRPIEEIVKSQAKMIERLKTDGAHLEERKLAASLNAHRQQVRAWMQNNPRVDFLEVDYPSLVADPKPFVEQLIDFLGEDRLPERDAMLGCVDRSLYRQRGSDLAKDATKTPS